MHTFRLVVVFAAIVMAAASTANAQQADVLAPARHGELQCYAPNVQAKTCEALESFTFDPQGKITNVGEAAIYPSPLVIMNLSTAVEVRSDGAVCGPLLQQDIDHMTFTVDGQAPSDEQMQSMRTQFGQQAASLIGVDTCTTFTPAADGALNANATIGGVPRPDMTTTVLWVRPGDGYHVAAGG
ncbi:MAG: hypothetical protein QM759_03760 [Terricaulis sp.]